MRCCIIAYLQLINLLQLQVRDAVAPTKNRTTNTTRRPAGQLLSVKAVPPGKKKRMDRHLFFFILLIQAACNAMQVPPVGGRRRQVLTDLIHGRLL